MSLLCRFAELSAHGCLLAVICAFAQLTSVTAQAQLAQSSAATTGIVTRPPADPNKFAVIISGASGEEAYAKQFAKWTAGLRSALVERLGFAEERLKILAEQGSQQEITARSTAEETRRIFESLRGAVRPDSTVFIFFIGHGSFDGKQSKFNLVGPDLTAAAYNELINQLSAGRVVVLNMSSASGEFVKALAGRGRIVITATRSGQEQNATRFAEHFIAALTDRDADADQNGRVSVMEAFNYANRLTGEFYKRAGRLASEHALIDDNGDGVGHQSAEEGDGTLARITYFDSLTLQQAAANAEVGRLLRDRTRLEEEIEQLKGRKRQMQQPEYEAALEKLFIELAKVNRTIKKGGQ